MQSFGDVQIKLLEHGPPLPVIPLTSPPDTDPAALPTTLRAFQSGLASGRSVAAAAGGAGGIVPVLPAAASLSARAAGALCARWPSLRELLREMATEAGRAAVGDAAIDNDEEEGEGEGEEERKKKREAAITFWQFEFAIS
ncbi:hypothetical protein VTH06DRAFT_484 [Thermothelomyces fergusii]